MCLLGDGAGRRFCCHFPGAGRETSGEWAFRGRAEGFQPVISRAAEHPELELSLLRAFHKQNSGGTGKEVNEHEEKGHAEPGSDASLHLRPGCVCKPVGLLLLSSCRGTPYSLLLWK